jgi:hypothetical protein
VTRSRKEKLLAGIKLETMSGLELGPLDRPLVDRRQGFRVRYLDHNSTEALRKRFQRDPNVDTAALAEIDFVIEGGNILEVVKDASITSSLRTSSSTSPTPSFGSRRWRRCSTPAACSAWQSRTAASPST